jgi:hypothetical protein
MGAHERMSAGARLAPDTIPSVTAEDIAAWIRVERALAGVGRPVRERRLPVECARDARGLLALAATEWPKLTPS